MNNCLITATRLDLTSQKSLDYEIIFSRQYQLYNAIPTLLCSYAKKSSENEFMKKPYSIQKKEKKKHIKWRKRIIGFSHLSLYSIKGSNTRKPAVRSNEVE